MVEVRLLGPVELWNTDGQVPLGPRQRRFVLAVLALTPGRPVTPESLVNRMWDVEPPRDPRNVIYSNISRLRSDLARVGVAVERRGNGYILDVTPDNIDLYRARRLAAQARSLVAEHADNAGEAVELLRSASTLWRDVPLIDLNGEWASRVRYGLNQERLAMVSQLCELELMVGQHAAAVGPLTDLVAEYPFDESLAALLMLALYRSGRQADALGAFTRLRQQLVDEIGDEPGVHVQVLHDKILRRDATLDRPDQRDMVLLHDESRAADSGAVPLELTLRPAQLPPDVAGFVGRTAELAALDEFVRRSDASPTAVVIAVIEGAAGVGKTALGIHWAHRARSRFPDGQLYADLHGYAPGAPLDPLHVLAQLLRALGISAERVPADVQEAAALYRSVLADRAVLVLLDNAATADQVRPLIPSGAGSMVLVTSRDHLGGLVARDGARRVRLGVLSRSEAESLLIALFDADRVQAEAGRISELAEFCAFLPLALRVAAANFVARPERSIADYLAEGWRSDRLAALAVPGDSQSAVAAALDLSYERLPDATRWMFRLLGLLPRGEVGIEAAARLAGTDAGVARRALRRLANAHLVEERTSGRFDCHDLLRHYAEVQAAHEDQSSDREAARTRFFDYYLEMTDAAAEAAFPQAVRMRSRVEGGPIGRNRFETASDATAWLDLERSNLVATVLHAADTGQHEQAWQLADNLRGYFWLHMHTAEWMASARAGLAAAEAAGNLRGQAAGHLSLASLHWRTGRFRDAAHHGTVALGFAQQADWTRGQAAVLGNLGLANSRLGNVELAASQLRDAEALSHRAGWRYGEASAVGNLGMMLAHAGQFAEAGGLARRALALTEELGSRIGQAINLLTLGIVDWVAGRYSDALGTFDQAHALFTEVQSSSGLCSARYWLAVLHCGCGRFEQASALAESTVALARDKGHREFEVHGLNALAAGYLRRAEYTTAIKTYRTAIDLALQLDERCEALAEAHIGMAGASMHVDDLQQARNHVEHGLVVAQNGGLRLLEAQALTVLAQVHFARRDFDTALEVGAKALPLHDTMGHRLGQGRTHELLGDTRWHLGDVDRAIDHWEHAERLLGCLDTGENTAPHVSRKHAQAKTPCSAHQGSRKVRGARCVSPGPYEEPCSRTPG